MPLNLPGILALLHLLINPRLVIPSIAVKDIRQLDFPELRRVGYRGVVFDKDNCLTIPHQDALIPALKQAWDECRETFGDKNVLIVSNTAGSHLDGGDIQAESVAHHLSVAVLRHSSFKPSYSCITSIRAYFASLPTPVADNELVIVGDRIFTDIVMANRMARRFVPRPSVHEKEFQEEKTVTRRTGPLAVWTENVWQRDNTLLRWMEKGVMRGMERWFVNPRDLTAREELRRRFVKDLPVSELSATTEGWLHKLWTTFRK
ncbi:HAD phosphatase [Sparassis latifolia]